MANQIVRGLTAKEIESYDLKCAKTEINFIDESLIKKSHKSAFKYKAYPVFGEN